MESWPEWTQSIEKVEWLGEKSLAVGGKVRIKQPGMPPLVWELTEVVPGASFTWRTGSPGVTSVGSHALVELSKKRCRATLGLEQSGLLAPLVALILGRQTRRYVEMEAEGLKRRSEQVTPREGPRRALKSNDSDLCSMRTEMLVKNRLT